MPSTVSQPYVACLPLPSNVKTPPYPSKPSSKVSTSEMLSLTTQVSWFLPKTFTTISIYSGVISYVRDGGNHYYLVKIVHDHNF